jgi:hypothetical protein
MRIGRVQHPGKQPVGQSLSVKCVLELLIISNFYIGHFMHLPSGKAYNGVTPTIAEMEDPANAIQKLPTLDSTSTPYPA